MVRRFLRLPAVMEATGYSRSTVYEKVKRGKLPRPVKLDPDGKAVGWRAVEIEALQQRAVAASAGKAADDLSG
jgi:prophage regulatory protein